MRCGSGSGVADEWPIVIELCPPPMLLPPLGCFVAILAFCDCRPARAASRLSPASPTLPLPLPPPPPPLASDAPTSPLDMTVGRRYVAHCSVDQRRTGITAPGPGRAPEPPPNEPMTSADEGGNGGGGGGGGDDDDDSSSNDSGEAGDSGDGGDSLPVPPVSGL